jgi:hypothetical protein
MTVTLALAATAGIPHPSQPSRSGDVQQRAPSPVDHLDAGEMLKLLPTLPNWPSRRGTATTWTRGAARILHWLAAFDGHGWQERWVAASGDDYVWADKLVATDISDRRGPVRSRDELLRGLRALLYLRAIRPGYVFFMNYKPSSLYDRAREVIEPEAFNRCYDAGQNMGISAGRLNDAMTTIVRMVLHTGTAVDDLRETDFVEMRDDYRRAGEHLPRGSAQAWDILGSLGVLTESRPFAAVVRRHGQPSTAELVDSYGVACRPVRDVMVRYLDQKRPAMDFSSFRSVVTVLVGLFWVDIEKHHPGIDTLHLPAEVAEAWKQRLRVVVSKGVVKPRRFYITRLVTVRSFYLDIAEWAPEDPTWAQWAVPCPIRRGETIGLGKEKAKVTAEMHQRIRERLPYLDTIVEAVEDQRRGTSELLDHASGAPIRQIFEYEGLKYQRVAQYARERAARHMGSQKSWCSMSTPAKGMTPLRRKTTRSGAGLSSRRCATPVFGSRNFLSSPSWRLFSTS